jgi:hypothetical protein
MDLSLEVAISPSFESTHMAFGEGEGWNGCESQEAALFAVGRDFK